MKFIGTTKITGVFGWPVEHSLSPVFQNAAFQASGLDYVYIPFSVKPQDLQKAVGGIRVLNIRGVNITIPHKLEIVKFLDEYDEDVKTLGVANTVLNDNGRLKGFITDGAGFTRSIKEDGKFSPEGKNVLIIGAGGASYAITGALIKEKVSKIIICNRTEEKTIRLKEYFKKIFPFFSVDVIDFEKRLKKESLKGIDLLINATSCGMKEDDVLLVPENILEEHIFVYDIVYNRKTELIRAAKNRGLKYLNGLSMLIYQGAISYEIWTGEKAPVEAMKKSLSYLPAS